MVLVILAILAAILVPALLGWIDEARNKQYVLQARNIVIAAQTLADEAYAAQDPKVATYVKNKVADIQNIADVAMVDLSGTGAGFGLTDAADFKSTTHDSYTITSANFDFIVKTGDPKMHAVLASGAWTISPATSS